LRSFYQKDFSISTLSRHCLQQGQKKWQVTYIAPLQPFTLAAFLPWGSSIGAGRIRLADAKIGEYDFRITIFFKTTIFWIFLD